MSKVFRNTLMVIIIFVVIIGVINLFKNQTNEIEQYDINKFRTTLESGDIIRSSRLRYLRMNS